MKILIPMAGEGQRFQEKGYKVPKPLILTTSLRTKQRVPMVVAACLDLPEVASSQFIFVVRQSHFQNEHFPEIKKYIPASRFITAAKLTEGQACTCLLAKEFIENEEELLISGCDNGIVYDEKRWSHLKASADVLVFTYRNNESVMRNPNSYGWVKANAEGTVTGVSVKKAISQQPLLDHAIVASFWFRRGKDFVSCAEEMIQNNDRINGEFYVDQVLHYAVVGGLKVKVFEVEKYLCWGTPADYEEYEKTVQYWKSYLEQESLGIM